MRDGPTDSAVQGALGWTPVVSAWRGGRVTLDNVQVVGGHATSTASQAVPERLTMKVPRYMVVNGKRFDLKPSTTEHPLARYGQYLTVAIRTEAPTTGLVWTTKIGTYRIQNWSEDDGDGSIDVEGVGMLQVIAGWGLETPMAPLPGGTLLSEFRRLLPPGFYVQVDPGLVDRACPQSFAWEDDRLGALYDIAEAWPARLRASADGFRLLLLPPLPSSLTTAPATIIRDGERSARGMAVVSKAPAADTRDGGFNRVTARNSGTDSTNSAPLQVTVDQIGGPMGTDGPYGVEQMHWSSPLATTEDSLRASAQTLLANNLRPSRTRKATIAPDPRFENDDALTLEYGGTSERGWVVGHDIPLTVDDGAMVLNVGVSQ